MLVVDHDAEAASLAVAGQADDRVVDRERRRSRRPPRSTATPAPAGRARSATRSGSRSTSARPRSITQVVLNWEAAYATAFQIQTSTDGTTWTIDLLDHHRHRRHADAERHRHRPLRPDVRHRPRHAATATRCGSSRSTARSAAPAARCGTTDAAQGKPATASSPRTRTFPASAAVDGNTGTRWSSAFSDPQWLQVDLGSTQRSARSSLNWEAAYATAFQIQTSADATTWTSIYSTTPVPAARRR